MTLEKSSNLVQSVKKISYQLSRSVSSIVEGSSKYHRVVTFNGVDWMEIYFTPGSAKFSEAKNNVDAGVEYGQKLTFRFPGEISAKYADIELAEILGCVVRVEFSSGVVKLMGTTDVPAFFDSDFKSDASTTGSDFAFTCISTDRAYLLE